ncbi:uncharacterized protein LOC134217222 [Armigeres subalbatus]|uniref:uncharacterized protein LOC134217222 n=1 Tax=Armigeres subalbatus TaxID=124917 RepID=UPI002ED1B413
MYPQNLLTIPAHHHFERQISEPIIPTSPAVSSPLEAHQHLRIVHTVDIISPYLARTCETTQSTTSSIRIKGDELSRSASSPLMSSRSKEIPGLDSQRSSHCPVVREGPALGYNFCWNTRRILRQKPKYHCPECQTNLCIAPCFQEYHERQSAENPAPTSNDSGSGCVYGVGGLYAKMDLRFFENLV